MSYRRILALTALLLLQGFAATATDRQGNYTSSDFFVPGDEYAISTWQVTTARLNCRQRPGNNQPILRTFNRNDTLDAKTSEGSHDNVGFLQKDPQGKPWIRIYQNPNDLTKICFVRAHRDYVKPIVGTR
jgi:hypothetical protein